MLQPEELLIAIPSRLEYEIIKNHVIGLKCKTVLCGVGPACAAMKLTMHILQNDVKALLLAGIAGGFQDKIDLLDVVCATSETFADSGRCNGSDFTPIDLPEEDLPTFFPLHHVRHQLDTLENKFSEVKYGQMVTLSCVSGSKEAAKRVMNRFPAAVCENMEGASGAMVAQNFQIPFFEIRGISNVAGETDTTRWLTKEAMNAVAKKTAFLSEALCS